ncbi:hypothetical protein Salat_0238600 [Sesamum alatum]|uniref:Uncharacterized protein n=1 Tax=Sesamum alatum TaxID=300844 RepID=A0AAE2CYU0_9LAMI|nr:hypothetical protein Salat_0238600 [Sesamum alatum]
MRPNLNLCSRDGCPYTDKGCMDSREERSRGGPPRTARIPRVNRSNRCTYTIHDGAAATIGGMVSRSTMLANILSILIPTTLIASPLSKVATVTATATAIATVTIRVRWPRRRG